MGRSKSINGVSSPESTLGHLKDQLVTVEGIFRLLPSNLAREDAALLAGIRDLLTHARTEGILLSQCRKATLDAGGSYGLKRRVSDLELSIAVDAPEAPRKDECWCRTVASIVLRVSQSLMREITKDEFMTYVIQWCDTPRRARLGVAYRDKAVVYGAPGSAEPLTSLTDSSPETDLYIRIPHQLLDPVLIATQERLHKYYRESFWTNFKVYKCMLAAQTLAKRGINVDRLFIGLSPGGVGQSLFTLHLAAIYGKGNHTYYDPNIWCLEEELRKQAEDLACCIVLTGQETPTGARGIKEDLFKRFITGERPRTRVGPETLRTRDPHAAYSRLETTRGQPSPPVHRCD